MSLPPSHIHTPTGAVAESLCYPLWGAVLIEPNKWSNREEGANEWMDAFCRLSGLDPLWVSLWCVHWPWNHIALLSVWLFQPRSLLNSIHLKNEVCLYNSCLFLQRCLLISARSCLWIAKYEIKDIFVILADYIMSISICLQKCWCINTLV